ncbi:MAG: hypothetical protein HQK49_14260 [Oligoflexia bacterium]|nr:hypothetical protein [Oligoflexia bacterium]
MKIICFLSSFMLFIAFTSTFITTTLACDDKDDNHNLYQVKSALDADVESRVFCKEPTPFKVTLYKFAANVFECKLQFAYDLNDEQIGKKKKQNIPLLIKRNGKIYFYGKDLNNKTKKTEIYLGSIEELKDILPKNSTKNRDRSKQELDEEKIKLGEICALIKEKGGAVEKINGKSSSDILKGIVGLASIGSVFQNEAIELIGEYVLNDSAGHLALGVSNDKGDMINYLSWPFGFSYREDLIKYNMINSGRNQRVPTQISFCISKERYLYYAKQLRKTEFWHDREDISVQTNFIYMRENLNEIIKHRGYVDQMANEKLKHSLINFFNKKVAPQIVIDLKNKKKIESDSILQTILPALKKILNIKSVDSILNTYLKNYLDYFIGYHKNSYQLSKEEYSQFEKDNENYLKKMVSILEYDSSPADLDNCFLLNQESHQSLFKSDKDNCVILFKKCKKDFDLTLQKSNENSKSNKKLLRQVNKFCSEFNKYQENIFRMSKKDSMYGKKFDQLSGLIGHKDDGSRYNCADVIVEALDFIFAENKSFFPRKANIPRIPHLALGKLEEKLNSIDDKNTGISPLPLLSSLSSLSSISTDDTYNNMIFAKKDFVQKNLLPGQKINIRYDVYSRLTKFGNYCLQPETIRRCSPLITMEIYFCSSSLENTCYTDLFITKNNNIKNQNQKQIHNTILSQQIYYPVTTDGGIPIDVKIQIPIEAKIMLVRFLNEQMSMSSSEIEHIYRFDPAVNDLEMESFYTYYLK